MLRPCQAKARLAAKKGTEQSAAQAQLSVALESGLSGGLKDLANKYASTFSPFQNL